MPTYQYACTACGHRFDAVQAFSDGPLSECPECTGRLRKVYSAVGVVFKGSGFYRNDSRAAVAGNKSGDGEASSADKAGADKAGADKAGPDKPAGDKAAREKKPAASASTPSANGKGGSSAGNSKSPTASGSNAA